MPKEHGNFKHGMKHTRLYHIWCNMKARCNNPNHTYYANYGGRGITVCDEWNDFIAFRDWASNNGYSDVLTIDRKNTNEGYIPENCRWVTMKILENNRTNNRLITFDGITMSIGKWAEKIGVPYKTLYTRLFQHHWTIERALEGGKEIV